MRDYLINYDEQVTINNGSYDLEVSASALLTLYDALKCKGFNVENERIADTMMLAIQKIEEVYLELNKIKFREYTGN